jgi:hypothetical protein
VSLASDITSCQGLTRVIAIKTLRKKFLSVKVIIVIIKAESRDGLAEILDIVSHDHFLLPE